MYISIFFTNFAAIYWKIPNLIQIVIVMTLSNQFIFLTTDIDGFRTCRETLSQHGMTVILCTEGYIDLYYFGEMVRVKKNDLFVRIPSHGFEIGPYEYSSDYEFMQLTVDDKIFEQVMFDHMRMEPNWFAKQEYVRTHPVFALNEASREYFMSYFHMFELHLRDRQTEYRTQIMLTLGRCATMEMLNYIDKLAVINPDELERMSVNQSDYTFREFMRLLQQYPYAREVKWYAERMKITPKYLSEICKELSGKSASQWIAEVTVAELKHLLRNTTMSIHEIANQMQFPNASFFCQYTKKHTGMSPNQYRKELKV